MGNLIMISCASMFYGVHIEIKSCCVPFMNDFIEYKILDIKKKQHKVLRTHFTNTR